MAKSDEGKAEAGKPESVGGARRARPDAKPATRLDSRSAADVAFVDALARLLKSHDLAEIEVEREEGDKELKVRLSRYGATQLVETPIDAAARLPTPPLQLGAPAAASAAPGPEAESAPENPAEDPNCVTSPMVGTVYLAPEPGAAHFVQPGDTVAAGQTLLIIEAMKTMNQIPSPRAGTVKEVLAENAQPVEFGAPLVILA